MPKDRKDAAPFKTASEKDYSIDSTVHRVKTFMSDSLKTCSWSHFCISPDWLLSAQDLEKMRKSTICPH